jgi:hypothetical protein
MPGWPASRPRSALAALAVAAIVAGCNPFHSEYRDPPPATHAPDTVGVIASIAPVTNGDRLTLADGRTVDEPYQAGFERLGAARGEGYLLLAGPGWTYALAPLPPRDYGPDSTGCWDAWPGGPKIAWDLGDSVEFDWQGLVLKKAPGFTADPAPTSVDGRLAWAIRGNAPPGRACANASGQVVWIKVDP